MLFYEIVDVRKDDTGCGGGGQTVVEAVGRSVEVDALIRNRCRMALHGRVCLRGSGRSIDNVKKDGMGISSSAVDQLPIFG